MPRVSGVYSRPAGIDAVSGAVIESADYNLNIADVETDLNTPRPIVAGGTGASNVTQARANLQTERAMATVTNYGSDVFENGSFWSDFGAAGAPVAGHRFVGTAIVANNNQDFVTLTARDIDDTANPGIVWVREKLAGTWNPSGWVQESVGALGNKVDKAGDTMTGALTISSAWASLNLTKPASGSGTYVQGSTGATARWQMMLGDSGSEGGSDTGSNFQLIRCSDAGTAIANTLGVARATGDVSVASGTAPTSPAAAALTVAGGIGCNGIFSGQPITISNSLAGNFGLNLKNANAAANATAFIQLENNGGHKGYVFVGSTTYGSYGGPNSLNIMTDVADDIAFLTAGAKRGYVAANGSLVWGTPTSGSNGGPGSINAQTVYDDGTLLTCFGVEYLKYGKVDLPYWDSVSPAGKHEPARKFAEMIKEFDPRDPRAYIKRMLADEALPGMPTKAEWKQNQLSLGEMNNKLWLAVELLATAFAGALDRIELLEKQRG